MRGRFERLPDERDLPRFATRGGLLSFSKFAVERANERGVSVESIARRVHQVDPKLWFALRRLCRRHQLTTKTATFVIEADPVGWTVITTWRRR